MNSINFLELEFSLIGEISPIIDANGQIIEELPQSRYKEPTFALNKYGAGPYCRFKIARGIKQAGIYIIFSNDIPIYIGETENLEKRYNSNGYGGISPRNCYVGGQETNCRINNLILTSIKRKDRLNLWFSPMIQSSKRDRVAIESKLVLMLRPAWNR